MRHLPRFGFELPLLLAGAFRVLVDALHDELTRRGHPGVRPVHGFAMQAIGGEGASTSELARRLGVSKQAAAKTVASLEQLGYIRRRRDVHDRRAQRVALTPRGVDCLRESAEIFEQLRRRWEHELGAQRVAALEEDLEAMAGGSAISRLADLPGWLRG